MAVLRPRSLAAVRLLPALGPALLFALWFAAVEFRWVSPVLLPTPGATLAALARGVASGSLNRDFLVTVLRTVESFLIAAAFGVPVGILLGSNERAYRSVEFLVDFFRSTPS